MPSKDTRFEELLKQLAVMHAKKGEDYGDDEDLYANIRASADFGIAPWTGAILRMNDKMKRLASFAKKGKLANEGVEDSLLDMAVYSLIALILFRETIPPPPLVLSKAGQKRREEALRELDEVIRTTPVRHNLRRVWPNEGY